MKKQLLLKLALVLPVIIFVDYTVMITLGCVSVLIGADTEFYCGPYCSIGKAVVGLSLMFFIYLILRDILKYPTTKSHGTTI